MKRLPFLFALLGSCLLGFAGAAQQLPPDTLIYDNLTTSRHSWWPVVHRADGVCEFKAGTYYVGRLSRGTTYATKLVALTPDADYLLEATLRLRGRVGLLWGYMGNTDVPAAPPGDYRALAIETTGGPAQAAVWRCQSGQWAREYAEPLPAGFEATAPHTLAVARQNGVLRFTLDGHPLGYHPPDAAAWQGVNYNLGFYAEDPGSELWMNRVLVRHHSRVRLAPNVPRKLRREVLRPGSISTAGADELSPLVSADGQLLYFARSVSPPETHGTDAEDYDIFVAARTASGAWGPARRIKELSNSAPNGALHVSPDGQLLLLRGRYTVAGEWGGSGLSKSQLGRNGQWGLPQDEFVGSILTNESGRTSYFINDAGTVLLASLGTEENPANKDLYFLHREGTGWSAARSLGPTINTSRPEQAPFLAPDGQTLYFASAGHPGYGYTDIFMSRRLDDSWTRWSEPLNLGPGVNTAGAEIYFSVPASGEFGYLSADSEQQGANYYDADLYRLLLPPSLQPNATELVKGRVLDARTGQPVGTARLRYERLPDGQQQGDVQVAADGTFAIALADGALYGFRAEAPGYVSASNNLDLTDAKAYGEVTQDVYLLPLTAPVEPLAARPAAVQPTAPAADQPLLRSLALPAPREEKITLNNVFFIQGKPVLLPSSFPELTRLAQTLQQNPGLRIRLDGHTDNTGDDKNPKPNQTLSEQRVAAVKAYLVKRGVAESRLETQGFGGTRPVAPNDSEANKRKNRRVEFVIVSR